MSTAAPASDLERRKHVRLRRRADLNVTPQKYEGKTYYFCSDGCKKKFDADPKKYVQPPPPPK